MLLDHLPIYSVPPMKKFQSEIQQILLEHGLSASSAFATEYIESHLLAQLLSLLHRLRILLRSSAYAVAVPGVANPPSPPYIQLLLLLLHYDPVLHYRLSLYLALEESRRRGRESAYGYSELEAPAAGTSASATAAAAAALGNDDDPTLVGNATPSVGAGATSRPAPEDAWDHPEIVPDNLSYLYTSNAHLRPVVQRDVLSIYEEYALPPSPEEQDGRLKRRRVDGGWEEHIARMKEYDERAKRTQIGEYVQLEEGRLQAGFSSTPSSSSSSSTKTRSSKRFKEFISPHLLANDIPPSSATSTASSASTDTNDELIDALAFLSKEIVIRLLEAGRAIAQRRIARLAQAQRQAEEAKSKLDIPKSKKRKVGSGGKGSTAERTAAETGADDAGKGKATQQEEAEEEAKRKKESTERRAAELNSRPTGPFSGPSASASSAASAAETAVPPMHNRQSPSGKDLSSITTAESQGAGKSQGEQGVSLQLGAEKRDPVVGSDINSPLDVLLGDFEEAALNLPMLGSSSSSSAECRKKESTVSGLQGPARGFGKPGGYNRAWRNPALRVR